MAAARPQARKEFGAEASIDLHRRTVAQAEEELGLWLDAKAAAGHRKVLVIHGAKTLATVVRGVLDAHTLVERHAPDNPGATRVWLGIPKKVTELRPPPKGGALADLPHLMRRSSPR